MFFIDILHCGSADAFNTQIQHARWGLGLDNNIILVLSFDLCLPPIWSRPLRVVLQQLV